MIGVLIVPAYLAIKSAEEGVHIQVLDNSGADVADRMVKAVEPIGSKFTIEPVPSSTSKEVLLSRIRDKKIDGYLVLKKDLIDGGGADYFGDNATNLGFEDAIEDLVEYAVRGVRAERAGIKTEQLAQLLLPVKVNTEHTTGTGEASDGKATFAVG